MNKDERESLEHYKNKVNILCNYIKSLEVNQ